MGYLFLQSHPSLVIGGVGPYDRQPLESISGEGQGHWPYWASDHVSSTPTPGRLHNQAKAFLNGGEGGSLFSSLYLWALPILQNHNSGRSLIMT